MARQPVPAAQRKFYQELHRLADKLKPKIRRQFLQAIKDVQGKVQLRDLADAIERRSPQQILEVLGLMKQTGGQGVTAGDAVKTAFRPMQDNLRVLFTDAANAAVGVLPKAAQAVGSFDLVNPRSVQFLQNYQFSLITPTSISRAGLNVGINAATVEGVRTVITDAFQRGGSPYEQAKQIRDLIGLNQRQAISLDNYRKALEESGNKADKIEYLVDRQYDRLLTDRAEMIARTETIRAANAGQQGMWEQAQDEGYLPRDGSLVRVWIITPDDRLCPICEAIPEQNEDGVAMNQPFITDNGYVMFPPAHPRCRCAIGLEEAGV